MNIELPLVSVILPVYNCETTITEAIDSIVNQTYSNWELIVCDDCSTDKSYEILKSYKEKLGKKMILLQNQKNSKIATTLNHCLKYAKGIYIARMDGDDRSKTNRFEKQVDFLNKHLDIDCVGAGMEIFDENGIRGIRRGEEYPNKKSIFKRVPFSHPTIMMRKKVYLQLNGYRVSSETLRAEDLDLWFRFWNANFKGYNLQDILLEYRERQNDYAKRSLKASIGIAKVEIYYLFKHKYNKINLLFCFKPLIASLVPSKIMFRYHNFKMKK